MFGNGYKPKSTTKEAKEIIRHQIELYYGDKNYSGRGNLSTVQKMKIDADAYNAGEYPRKGTSLSDWRKGAGLVDDREIRQTHEVSNQSINLACPVVTI